MAEEKEVMQNIDINEFDNVQTLKDSDYFVLSLFEGTPARAKVSLLKSVLEATLAPSIQDGVWHVGAKSLGVKAEGKTPEFRSGTLDIEYRYIGEGDSDWRPLISYTDIKLQFDTLSKAQKDEIYIGTADVVQERLHEDVSNVLNPIIEAANKATKEASDAALYAKTKADEVLTEAMHEIDKRLDNQILSVNFEESGDLVVFTGTENSEFQQGYISESGDVVLEFIYE